MLSFDVLRITSCLMIVLMHSPMPENETPGVVLSGLSYFTAAGIGLFFMLSGALLLENGRNSVHADVFDVCTFLKKRIAKIGIPLAFWTIVGYTMNYYGFHIPEVGVLWFLWSIMGLYFLAPILIRWICGANNREVLGYLLVWSLSLSYPWIRVLYPVEIENSSWLYYFNGYVGYFVLGWYLMQKKNWGKMDWIILIVFLVSFSIVLPIVTIIFCWKVNFYDVFWYLSPSVVVMCISWFVCFLQIEVRLHSMNPKIKGAIIWLSNQTFGIYLVHIIIMRTFLWNTEWMRQMNGMAQIPVCFVLTVLLSSFVTFLLKKLPYIKAVVGS